ncbi:small GTPase LIP1-like [Chenopodium quinoa]|uniref:small GTPase LIP1-like n=1 Tax=Chenopodium quinoa TaxID=63459 RepID=UPI000B78153F|nr:small GTPase LIP1-like [Chenopodium quinoa]
MRVGGLGGLPVLYIVVSNKADIAAKEGTQGSSGNLVDVARQWVEKQGLLPPSEELPLTESFPGNGALLAELREQKTVNQIDKMQRQPNWCTNLLQPSWGSRVTFSLYKVPSSTLLRCCIKS